MLESLIDFFQNDDITLITSHSDITSWATDKGLRSIIIDAIETLPPCVLDICCSMTHYAKMGKLIERSPLSKVISIPQASFDGDLPALVYSCERLLESDILRSLSQQSGICSLLEQTSRIFLHDAENHCAGHCDLDAEIDLSVFDTADFLSLRSCSVAQLFEASIEHADQSKITPFDICGEFRFSGLLAARSPRYQGKKYDRNAIANLIRSVAKARSKRLLIRQNKIISMTLDGVDIAPAIRHWTGPRALNITEFAIGVNDAITSSIDWHINSQMNEGIKGIHFGVGDGVSGLHVDILCPHLTPEFLLENDVHLPSAFRQDT